jgi:hypothetical protein
MPKEISSKIVVLTFGVLVICFTTAFYVVAWQEPSQAPPGGNVAAPLNVGSVGQVKQGWLANLKSFFVGSEPTEAEQSTTGILRTTGGAILNTGGAPNGLIVQSGNVGIGTVSPGQKLEVEGIVKSSGFQVTTGAGVGKIFISDASGIGSWQTAPDNFAGVSLVNYGSYNSATYCYGQAECGFSVSACPAGWTQAGLGHGDPGYTLGYGGWAQGTQIPVITKGTISIAYRTCFRIDAACAVLVNYGMYNSATYCYGYQPECGYAVSACPAGWTQAGLGAGIAAIYNAYYNTYPGTGYDAPAYRTCFLCQ